MVRSLLWLISLVIGIVEALLGARFVLRLVGANPAAGFVNWLYDTTDPIIAPFSGAFASPVIERGMVLEFTTLFALVVYGFIAYLASELLRYVAANVDWFHRGHAERSGMSEVEREEYITHDTHAHHHV